MDEEIKRALIALLDEEVIVASWGLSDLSIKDSSFEFRVSGFIYQGWVKVAIQGSTYVVSLENGIMRNCTIENLVQCLDYMIEKTPDYEATIIEWIKS